MNPFTDAFFAGCSQDNRIGVAAGVLGERRQLPGVPIGAAAIIFHGQARITALT